MPQQSWQPNAVVIEVDQVDQALPMLPSDVQAPVLVHPCEWLPVAYVACVNDASVEWPLVKEEETVVVLVVDVKVVAVVVVVVVDRQE